MTLSSLLFCCETDQLSRKCPVSPRVFFFFAESFLLPNFYYSSTRLTTHTARRATPRPTPWVINSAGPGDPETGIYRNMRARTGLNSKGRGPFCEVHLDWSSAAALMQGPVLYALRPWHKDQCRRHYRRPDKNPPGCYECSPNARSSTER